MRTLLNTRSSIMDWVISYRAGAPLFEFRGGNPVDRDVLLHAVVLGDERALDEDLAYGFRLLVDVAVRAVSEAMSDPTTATQAVDRIHDLLRQLVSRPLPDGRYVDCSREAAAARPNPDLGGPVRLAVDEVRLHGRHSLQVMRRLEAMLRNLIEVAAPQRQVVLEHELRLLESAMATAFESDMDRPIRGPPRSARDRGWRGPAD